MTRELTVERLCAIYVEENRKFEIVMKEIQVGRADP